MKIQGTQPSVNAYKQLQNQHIEKKNAQQKDQLKISNAAKQMQKSGATHAKRAHFVQETKHLVQSGEYTIDPDKIADKMINFWSGHSS